jgi:hypothetical protein
MQTSVETSRLSHVTALFADRALSFALPHGATLKDLAERFDGLKPSTITIKLAS